MGAVFVHCFLQSQKSDTDSWLGSTLWVIHVICHMTHGVYHMTLWLFYSLSDYGASTYEVCSQIQVRIALLVPLANDKEVWIMRKEQVWRQLPQGHYY